MSNVVLITGVSRHLGGRLAAQLAADPSVDRVIGVDTTPPRSTDLARLGRTEFVRADIRNPLIAKVMSQAHVDTVVHASVLATPRVSGRVPMKEMNVIGTMQLLAACQKSDTVSRVVVKSTTAVYGSSPHDPAVFTEDMEAINNASGGYAQDAVEVEGYVRGFLRRRPDITVTVLRLASVIGPEIETPLAHYLAMPVVPTALGYDPRLQLLHESDAVEVMRLATISARPGVFNVAGEGVVTLAQAVRLARRLRLPVPSPAILAVGALVRNSGVIEFSAEQASFLSYGRVVDTTLLRTQYPYTPQYTTREALQAFLDARPVPRLPLTLLTGTERALTGLLDRRRSDHLNAAAAITAGLDSHSRG
jgi:UDP-glucose 4-epimerase